MNIYEIGQELQTLNELYFEAIDEETGEIKNADILEEFEKELQIQLATKGAGIIRAYRNTEALINGTKTEIERLTKAKKVLENRNKQFKDWVLRNMEIMGVKKIETELGTMSIRKGSGAIEIYDEKLLDEKFFVENIEKKVSKVLITEAINKGKEVQGAKLVFKNSLTIK